MGCHGTTGQTAKGERPGTSGSPTWIRYTDNAEGAFSVEVPIGWQVEGGMYRFGYFDVRWMMNIRSLDGKVIIRLDDPNVPPYVLPGPHSRTQRPRRDSSKHVSHGSGQLPRGPALRRVLHQTLICFRLQLCEFTTIRLDPNDAGGLAKRTGREVEQKLRSHLIVPRQTALGS
jgi:hypothetical protein